MTMQRLPSLRHLRYLSTLAETHHFGRAAQNCHVTQSTLSAGLKELESALGARLVERTKRRVMLTPLGEEVVARSRRLLQDAAEIVELTRAAAGPLTGVLRLGVIPTIAPFLLPRVLPKARKAYPKLRLRLREDLTDRLLSRLVGGDLDLALLALPYEVGDLETLELGEDAFLLACPPEHPLATSARLTPDDLARGPLLLLEEGHCLSGHALAACRLAEAPGSAELQATSLHTLVHMVAGGLGVTLLPEMAVKAGLMKATGLVARPLPGRDAARKIGFVWRRSSPRKDDYRRLAAHFSEALRG
jgi:LysR family hydrogen peroxide-inducible transcriptional activator